MGGESNFNRAVVYTEPGTTKTEVVELPIPTPGPGEVLVRLLWLLHERFLISAVPYTKRWEVMKVSRHLGSYSDSAKEAYERVGEVVAVGVGVTTPAIGQRVGIKYAADACLNCDGLDSAEAAPLMCAGVSVYTALKRADARHGDWIVIAGAGGGLGHLAIQYANVLGCRVLAMDLGIKEKFCRDLGAQEFVDFTSFPTEEDLANEIKRITGGGARIVLMCSSNKKAYIQSPRWLGFRGKLVCLGVPEHSSPAIGEVEPMLCDELTIFGVKTGNRLEAKECLEIAARGKVKTHFQLRRMRSLTKIFTEMESGEIQGRVVIDLK
ncbi:hypothetical protein COL26b_008997 [Colletotrichum chrysophilum]|uniref:uncharacterized protein n=1 Tax=Colletotrichum chrysophilum TaxID=1836956 RepID=UPI002301BEDF|nr:uncharacterized protein COL26b_008997 [Colletotrichum chrysophilum]KAJ0372764.1 hypothetical protein COL26b_008997 [Colletotrichum chrysophilum]